MKIRKSDILDVVLIFGIMAIVWACYAAIGTAAPVCNVCRIQKQAVIQQVAAYPPPAVYYAVNRAVQEEAAATLQFRHSEEYIELQQLRGFKAGVDAVAAVSGDRPSSPAGLANKKGGDNPAGAEQPPAPPADPYATLKQTCAKCHSGETPKGDIWLDGSVSLEGPDAATKRDAIVAAMRTGHMPPTLKDGHRLDLEVREAIEDEIYGVEVVAAEPTPPEGE